MYLITNIISYLLQNSTKKITIYPRHKHALELQKHQRKQITHYFYSIYQTTEAYVKFVIHAFNSLKTYQFLCHLFTQSRR